MHLLMKLHVINVLFLKEHWVFCDLFYKYTSIILYMSIRFEVMFNMYS